MGGWEAVIHACLTVACQSFQGVTFLAEGCRFSQYVLNNSVIGSQLVVQTTWTFRYELDSQYLRRTPGTDAPFPEHVML